MMTALTVVIAVAFLLFKIQQKDMVAVLTFVLVLSILVGCCQLKLCRCLGDIRICVLLAVLAANVVSLPKSLTSESPEAFTNPRDKDDEEEKTSQSVDDTQKKTHNEEKEKDDDDVEEENYVDNFSTFMETFKSLTPGQIETMTTDTKDLIETQKTLMETVKSLAPVITQGKEMMDTFKDYFGPNSHQDLLKAFKPNNKKSKA
jgi:hypothetical protein